MPFVGSRFFCLLLTSCLFFLPAGAGAADSLHLSLSDCIRMGVTSNLGMMQKQLEKEEKKFAIETAKRIFIPEVSLQVKDFFDRFKNVTVDQTVEKTFEDGSAGGFKSSSSSDWNTPDRNTRTHGFFLTRPLLRNFGRRVAGYALDLSRIDYDIGLERFKGDLNDFIFDLASRYLDLSFARKNLEITEQACLRAKQQFEDTKHDIELGTIAEQEIYLVEENLVEFDIRREKARHDIARLDLELKKLLNIDPSVETPLAVDELASGEYRQPASYSQAVETMFQENPDYKMKTLALKRSQTEFEYQRNQFLPQFDVNADYKWREGKGVSPRDFFSFGLQYSIPLSRDSDRAVLEKSRFGTRIQRLSVKDAETVLSYELKRIFLEMDHLEHILIARARVVGLSRKKLEAETEKYKNGFTTLADVVRFQRELENSMLEELSTAVSLNKLRLNQFLLEGTLYRLFDLTIGS